MPSLGPLTLPDDPVWLDEFGEWSPVKQSIEEGLTGALIIDQGVRQGGRPITLDVAWLTRAELLAVNALADVPNTSYVLIIHQGTYTVIFDRPPLTVRAIREVSDPDSAELYAVVLRLLVKES